MKILRFITAILILAFKRLYDQKWLTLATLIGLITAIGLVYSVPFYTDAVYHRILVAELSRQTESAKRSPFEFLFAIPPKPEADYSWSKIKTMEDYLKENGTRDIGLPQEVYAHSYKSDNFSIFPAEATNYSNVDLAITRMYFGTISDMSEHITIIAGEYPEESTGASNRPIGVLVSEGYSLKYGFQPGEIYTAYRQWVVDDIRKSEQTSVYIAGIWKPIDPEETYWYYDPTSLDDVFLMPEDTFQSDILSLLDNEVYFAIWYLVMDGSNVHAGDVGRLLTNIYRIQNKADGIIHGVSLFRSPEDAFRRYSNDVERMTALLYVFSVPIVGLLLAFISLVVGLSVQNRQNEVAVLRSRGASLIQVLGLVGTESLLLSILGMLFSLPVGLAIAKIVGRARSFLDFSLQTDLRSTLDESVFRLGLGVVGALVIIQVLPVINTARHTIISYKKERARSMRPPLWQRMGLDILLLIPTLYGAYVLNQQGSIIAEGVSQYDPLQNPLLLLIPALGILAVTLFVIRFLPMLMSGFAWLLSKTNSVGLLMAVRHLARTPRFYSSPLILLIVTLSLSIYTATLAQTLDQALYDQEYYQVGADMHLVEWGDNPESENPFFSPAPGNIDSDAPITYFFLPVWEHLDIPGVQSAARIGRYNGYTDLSGGPMRGLYLGIDRADFPNVAFWRSDFASRSLGELMNRLALQEDGVLVDRDYLARNVLRVGDPLTVRVSTTDTTEKIELKIVGAVDYFPTWYPEDEEGTYIPLFVGNLEYLYQQLEAVYPYDVWLDTDLGVDYEQIVGEANRKGLGVILWDAPLIEIQSQQMLPERQGLFGILSVGFLVAAFLTALGFLIYWIFSFRRRFVEMGVLQAIGLSSSQMIEFLGWELGLLTFVGGLFGTGLGVAVSVFFIPYLQLRNGAGAVPPYLVEISWAPVVRIYILFAFLFLSALIALVVLLRRMKIFQAIKLGETV
jgi:putative ABC transport system permease protein